MRTVNRIMATLAVASLFTSLSATTFADSAEAATRHANRTKGFSAPTLVGTTGPATCVEVSEGTYEVTVTFVVTGGRYANLGNPDSDEDFTYTDKVRAGGTRYVPSVTTTLHGWPTAEEFSPVTLTMLYSQVVAPLGKARDVTAWRVLESEMQVNLSCS